MRHGPDFKTVGNADYLTKYDVLRELEVAFYDHWQGLTSEQRHNLETFEYPLSDKERAVIAFANKFTNELITAAGEQPFDIPLENVHIVPPNEYARWDSSGDSRG